ncbi:MAG: prepilin-type N-terminal cleavage/methylation domain-containing protein [Nitrospira sp.]|nr:prepilin-type N-terminal cleavage/methylation domain-containing protein [Nitrospira sp.]
MRGELVDVPGLSKRVSVGWCFGSSGVSLIELLIAMAISGVAISASMHLFSRVGVRLTTQHATMIANQDLRIGLDVLCSELRLAGAGLLGGDSPFLKAEADEIEFFANLSGVSTTLTQATEVGRQDLPVEEGAGWPKGKHLLVCTAMHCAWNQLAADGRKQTLTLATPMAVQLPMRSAVFLLNRVRYYVKRQDDGTMRLMRDVDGGASTLVSDVGRFELQYLNNNGTMTTDAREVVRVRVTIQVGRQGSMLRRDVAIRM